MFFVARIPSTQQPHPVVQDQRARTIPGREGCIFRYFFPSVFLHGCFLLRLFFMEQKTGVKLEDMETGETMARVSRQDGNDIRNTSWRHIYVLSKDYRALLLK